MKIVREYELEPTNGRKSFNNKAKVFVTPTMTFLKSYDTIMCGYERQTGKVHRYSDYKSYTTCSHLKSFLSTDYNGFWDIPIEKVPDTYFKF